MTTSSPTPESDVPEDPQVAKLQLEVEYLKRQNEKIAFEIKELQVVGAFEGRIKRFLPVVTALIAVAGFWFGLVQYIRAEAASLEQRIQAEAARLQQQKAADELFRRELTRETARPLWEKQLSLYLEAAEKASTIATTQDETIRSNAEARFWVLYWGPLAAVEDVGLTKQSIAQIEAAMVSFGKNLEKEPQARETEQMKQLSLKLAHSIRNAVAPAFDVQATDLGELRSKSNPEK